MLEYVSLCFFSSRRRHTRCALVTGVQTWALPICLWPQVKENYPGIGAKKAAIDAAEYNKRAVKGAMLPQVNAQAQHTYGTYEGSAGAFLDRKSVVYGKSV